MTTVTSFASTSLLDRIGASRASLAAPLRQGAAANPSTRVTWGSGRDGAAVYSDPRARPGTVSLWASPVDPDDAVSALMARNRGLGSSHLRDQWRGLGGALLARFGQTGEGYSQTLVDDVPLAADAGREGLSPEEQAWLAGEIQARRTAALDGVATHASTAGLRVQTRSGQTVELQIAVNPGLDGIVGMKVELKASGTLSPEERAAVAQLAQGLDRALEGLGRDDAVGLDLSGLMGYDRGALASVDLTVNNSMTHQALGSFSLHLGDDKRQVALKGSDGEMRLSVDAATLPGGTAALAGMLARMGNVGERGRANAALVEQMKAAFTQLQAGPREADAASPLSGLADFDASLSGETWRSNASGTTNEAGQLAWQLSQKTTLGKGRKAATQIVSEELSADTRKAAPGRMLDVRTGNYAATHVRDRSTVTAVAERGDRGAIRALRKTDAQQLKTVTEFENHRVVCQQSWPAHHSLLERLGQAVSPASPGSGWSAGRRGTAPAGLR